MIYRGRERSVDTDKVLMRFMKSGVVHVAPYDRGARIALVEHLVSERFRQVGVVVGSEDSTRPKLPLSIDLGEKTITAMGNITCAAGAASCRVVIGVEEFYVLYEAWKIFRELSGGSDGSPVYYKRIKPCRTDSRPHPVDLFAIYRRPSDAENGVEPVCEFEEGR